MTPHCFQWGDSLFKRWDCFSAGITRCRIARFVPRRDSTFRLPHGYWVQLRTVRLDFLLVLCVLRLLGDRPNKSSRLTSPAPVALFRYSLLCRPAFSLRLRGCSRFLRIFNDLSHNAYNTIFFLSSQEGNIKKVKNSFISLITNDLQNNVAEYRN